MVVRIDSVQAAKDWAERHRRNPEVYGTLPRNISGKAANGVTAAILVDGEFADHDYAAVLCSKQTKSP